MPDQSKARWMRLFSADLLVAAVLCLFSFLVFAFLANEVFAGKAPAFDEAAFRFFDAFETPGNTRLTLIITFFGSGYFLFPFYIVLIIYLLTKGRKKYAAMIAAIAAVSWLLGASLKNIFQRSRPALPHLDQVSGYSFPSGHSLAAFTFCGIIITVIWRLTLGKGMKILLSVLFFLFACAIALSRIYLHVHYASDVLAGFSVTLIWLSVCFIYFSWDGKKWLV
ncbi:phosphatase PAP2 family protein [Filimonas effusa]|uniref:Phosphatase PAP2 family protein n=1 Tax=Filimonas effusa TaxID=2508721 RepID=A0A4Q1D1M7_9BACT|nr:phosphatase PAP2 family protein [Filimonas effusa]RXK81190.1 phosphatase PAP2 family protein [Filimonas effusa]